jgi:LysR family transcriptional regulator of gallate degradation
MIDTELRRATAEIDAMRGATKGKINVGSVPTMISPMTRAAREILHTHPGLKLEIRAAFSRELTVALLDGELDLALILIPEGGPPPGLAFESIRRTNPVIVARSEHPLAGRDKLTLDDLGAYPWLAATYPSTHWRILNRVFLDAGVPPPEAAMEVSTVVFFAPLIRETDMLTIMPRSMLSESPEGAGLVALPFELPFPAEQIVLAYRENSYLLPGAKIVMQHLKAVCADEA